MTNEKWSKLLGAFCYRVRYRYSAYYTFWSYMSLEETTSNMSMNVIGVFVSIGILFGAIKLIKRRIKMKKEIGLKVNPYFLLLCLIFCQQLHRLIIFTWLLFSIKSQIDTPCLCNGCNLYMRCYCVCIKVIPTTF